MFGEGGLGGGEAVTKPPLSPLQFITHCHPELACYGWQAGVTHWSEGSYFVALISLDNNDKKYLVGHWCNYLSFCSKQSTKALILG